MNTGSASSLLINLIVLVFFLRLQLRVRPLKDSFKLPLIFAVVGILELANFLKSPGQMHDTSTITIALAGSILLAAITAAIRAPSVHLFKKDGQIWRQGTWITLVLWVVSLGAHLVYDSAVAGGKGNNIGDVTLLIYFAVSLTVQRAILLNRASRKFSNESSLVETKANAADND